MHLKMMISNKFLFFLFAFAYSLQGSKAILKTTFIEDLCFMTSSAKIDLQYENSGIIMSVPRHTSSFVFQCELTLIPPKKASVALSIYRYDIYPGDRLIIQDSDKHTISLKNWATFRDEKKSMISDGKMIIRYTKNNTALSAHATKAGFQFTFTLLHDSPCQDDEFQCRNGKCLSKKLVCDGHNHCGDKSDQINCEPVTMKKVHPVYVPPSTKRYGWMITGTTVAASLLLIVILILIVAIIRKRVQKHKPQENQNGTAPLQSVSASIPLSNDLQRPTETFYNRVRRSLRGTRRPENEVPVRQETIQVPSMYPSLDQTPSAPELSGAENPNFRSEE